MQSTSRKPADLQRPRSQRVRFSVDTKVRTLQSRSIPYRVGYNWNKGGRLKELRIRHLARKFLKIWMQNTFGQIHPHVAKCHYDNVLQRRTFEGWRDELWASRKEWSLSLRADCHHKYYLLQLTFQNWQTFLSLQEEKKGKIQRAQWFDERRHKRRFFDRWENFVQMRRLKSRRNQMAREQHRRRNLNSIWCLWQMKLQQHQNICNMEDQALRHRTMILQSRAFLQWKEMHTAVCSQRENESKASLHYISSVKNKSLHQWQSFVCFRQHKRQSQVVATHAARLHLTRLSWGVWRSAWCRKQNEEDRLQGAGQLAMRVSQRRALLHWKAYVTRRKGKALRGHMASHHHHQCLQRAVLQGLSHHVSQNRAQQLNKKAAVQHHHQTMINKYWRLWKDRLEKAEDEPFQALTDMALTNYRMNLLSRSYDNWREKLAQQRHMQDLEWRADIWFAEHLLPHYLNSWIEFTLQRRLKKDRRHRADVYNKQRLCTWVLYTWQERSGRRKEEMLWQRMAILHEEQRRLQRAWARWRKQTHQQMGEGKEKHQGQRCPHVSVTQRKDATTELHGSEEQACLQGDLYCTRRVLDMWKKFVQRQKFQTNRIEQMQRCHEDEVAKHSFVAWKFYFQGQYRLNASEQTAQALWHWALTLQAKVFLAWREETKFAMSEQHQQRDAVSRAQSSLNQPYAVEPLQRETTGAEKAQRHHNTKLLCKALRAWNHHHHACLKYKVMKQQGMLVLRLKMYRSYFQLWRRKFQDTLKVAEQTQRALWHWALTLQAKVLDGWRLWVTEQRRKKMEAVEATQVYGDHMTDIRTSQMWHGNEARWLHIQSVVRYFFLRWKQRALCKPLTAQEVRHQPLTKRMTFCFTDLKKDSPSDSGECDADGMDLISPFIRRQPRRCKELFEPLLKVLPYDGLLASPGDSAHSCPSQTYLPAPQTPCDLLLPPAAFMSTEKKYGNGSMLLQDVHPSAPSGQTDEASPLIKELMSIQQDMRSFQQDRKQLRLWQRTKDVLHCWLQTSGKDEDMDKNSVCQQMNEMEERIERLSCELATRRPAMHLHAERLRHLQAALDSSGFSSLYKKVQM
ncbi:protein SFI1 homolog isoform X2 [Dunckerocampus dactyliophorus]|uniref:protein SFI1 homolog isoform X2 n=1 Tax=Dunckerocampus dactyliophorus TaxID=161453 RepID=UPI002405E781|nr:protein SFI1 homolog isoform X2 [Dunckerocampus dactyliophorus]